MLLSSHLQKMSHDKKFEQIWEFRRRDDDIDSSSDDLKSNSGSEEPVLKKHKLVSDFVLPENDDASDSLRSQDEGLLDHGTSVRIKHEKTNTECNGLRKKKSLAMIKKTARGSVKEASKKKSKRTSQVQVRDDLRIFTESIIEELRVARENMFAEMREEMRKLITSGSATKKPTRKKGVRKTSQKQQKKIADPSVKTKRCTNSLVKTAVSNKRTEAKNCNKVLEERDNHDQTNETITSDEKEKDMERTSVKNPIYSGQPDQVVSSLYLTLPSVLSESRATGNVSGLNVDRGNLLIDSTGHHNYFSSIQTDEPFQSFAQIGSKQTESFCMGAGFPISLHQRLDNSFNFPQAVLESSSRDSNNVVGLRMNGGGVRFSGGNHALPDHFAPNNFRSLYPN